MKHTGIMYVLNQLQQRRHTPRQYVVTINSHTVCENIIVRVPYRNCWNHRFISPVVQADRGDVRLGDTLEHALKNPSNSVPDLRNEENNQRHVSPPLTSPRVVLRRMHPKTTINASSTVRLNTSQARGEPRYQPRPVFSAMATQKQYFHNLRCQIVDGSRHALRVYSKICRGFEAL